MQARVLKTFKDKETKILHEAGTEIEVSEKRFKEINATKYGNLIEEIVEVAAEEPETAEKPNKKTNKKKGD